jgi:DHA2 family multidrug resistance protein
MALVVLVGSLMLGLSRGERVDWFDSTEIVIDFTIAALALMVVVYRVVTSTNSILERRLFFDKNYLVAIVFMMLFGGLTTLPVLLVPLMLQQVSGYPAIAAGEVMMAKGVGTMAMFMLVGVLMSRVDARIILCLGFTIYAATNLYMSTWTESVNSTAIMSCLLVMGAASGSTYIPVLSIALTSLARQLHTDAITFLFLVFNVGSAIGVAAIFALHTRLVQVNRSVLVEHITETNELLRTPGVAEMFDLSTASGLASLSAEISRQATVIAYVNSYLVVGVVAALVLPLIFLVKKPVIAEPE